MSVASDSSAQIAKIEQHVDGLRQALNRARWLRLLILIALVAVVIAIVFSFLNMAKRVTSESFVNEVTTLAQKHVTDHQDVYEKEMRQFVDTSFPVVSGAFNEQAKKDLPKFTEAIDKERDAFLASLRQQMDEKMALKYRELLKQHEDMIVAEFPDLKDEATREKVLANFQLVIEKLIKRNYGDQFDEESKKLIALWESFPAAEEPGPSDPKLEEKLLEHALQVAAGVMTSVQQASGQSAPLPVATDSAPAATTAAAPPKAPATSPEEGRKLPPANDTNAPPAAEAAKTEPAATEPPKAEEAKPEAPKSEPEAPKAEPEKPKEEPASSPPPATDPPK